MSRLRRILVRGACLVFGVGLGLAVAEALVDRFDPFGASYHREVPAFLGRAIEFVPEALNPAGRLFQNRPNLDLGMRRFRFCTDALGLRSAEPGQPAAEAPPGPAPVKVLCLGDSVTLCWGVDHAQGWPALVQAQARTPEGRPLQMFNAGHLLYNTIQAADLFNALAPKLQPEWLLLTVVSNDLEDNWELYQREFAGRAGLPATTVADSLSSPGEAPQGTASDSSAHALTAGNQAPPVTPAKAPTWQLRFERLASRYTPALLGVWRHIDNLPQAASVPRLPVTEMPEYQRGWPLAEAALDRLLAACQAQGCRLLLLDHSVPKLPGYEAWARQHGVFYADVNFTPAEWAQPVRLSAADQHSNALGNQLHAAHVLRALAAAGLSAPKAPL